MSASSEPSGSKSLGIGASRVKREREARAGEHLPRVGAVAAGGQPHLRQPLRASRRPCRSRARAPATESPSGRACRRRARRRRRARTRGSTGGMRVSSPSSASRYVAVAGALRQHDLRRRRAAGPTRHRRWTPIHTAGSRPRHAAVPSGGCASRSMTPMRPLEALARAAPRWRPRRR